MLVCIYPGDANASKLSGKICNSLRIDGAQIRGALKLLLGKSFVPEEAKMSVAVPWRSNLAHASSLVVLLVSSQRGSAGC